MTEVRRRGRPGQAEPVAQKGAQALERGIAILQYLEKSGGSSSVSDISLNLDLPLSTTFRLLKVLQAADFVYQDSQLGWWHIGLGVFNVGAAYIHNRDVLSVAGPFMRRLMLLSGETVNVAIRNGNEAVFIILWHIFACIIFKLDLISGHSVQRLPDIGIYVYRFIPEIMDTVSNTVHGVVQAVL